MIWPGVEVELIFHKGDTAEVQGDGHGSPLPQAWGLVEAGRESLSLHLGLGEGVVRAGLPRPRLSPSTVPGLETLGRGPIPRPELFGPESSFWSSASERLWPAGPVAQL